MTPPADRPARLRALLSVGTPGEIKNAAPSILTALDAAEALAAAVDAWIKDESYDRTVTRAECVAFDALCAFRAAMDLQQ